MITPERTEVFAQTLEGIDLEQTCTVVKVNIPKHLTAEEYAAMENRIINGLLKKVDGMVQEKVTLARQQDVKKTEELQKTVKDLQKGRQEDEAKLKKNEEQISLLKKEVADLKKAASVVYFKQSLNY